MQEIHWKIIFLILWFSAFLIRLPHSRRYKNTRKIEKVKNKRELTLALLAAIGSILLPLIWIISSLFSSFAMELPQAARWAGIGVYLISLWFFYKVHQSLGSNWSPFLEITDKHTLITTGLYQNIRHPMYSQVWLWMFAQWLITSNWMVGVTGLITWSTLYFTRVSTEEKMMLNHFGSAYREYMNQTGRLLPKIKRHWH
jgi:protein-S-isoprenylcysteine O-methyltransferase Ste14